MTVDWALVNDLVRNNLTDYPAMDHGAAMRAAEASRRCSPADLFGLSSLYAEPIFATSFQVTAGGHRITAILAGLEGACQSTFATTPRSAIASMKPSMSEVPDSVDGALWTPVRGST